jgi:hypothetical protein
VKLVTMVSETQATNQTTLLSLVVAVASSALLTSNAREMSESGLGVR